MHSLSEIDASAEREGAAIERMAEMTGKPIPMSREQLFRFRAIEAVERRLPRLARNHGCYNHGGAVAMWLKLLARMAKGNFTPPRIAFQTREMKARTQWLAAHRRLCISRLERMVAAGAGPVGFKQAIELAGLGERTIARAVSTGRLPILSRRHRTNSAPLIDPNDLLAFLRSPNAPRTRWSSLRRPLTPLAAA
jgi:hypothetical protein